MVLLKYAHDFLIGGFKYVSNVHPYLWKWSILTSIFFQMGWFNHQLDKIQG